MEKMQYLLSLFIYALKRNSKISINTLFRYAYIYSASCDYLDNSEEKENEVIIDKNIGIADYSILFEAIQRLNESEMITMTDSANIIGTDKIYIFQDTCRFYIEKAGIVYDVFPEGIKPRYRINKGECQGFLTKEEFLTQVFTKKCHVFVK